MAERTILVLCITDRVKHAAEVQQVLTKYGCNIKTRLGLHEAGSNICSANGLMFLELVGTTTEFDALEQSLQKIQGLDVRRLAFKI